YWILVPAFCVWQVVHVWVSARNPACLCTVLNEIRVYHVVTVKLCFYIQEIGRVHLLVVSNFLYYLCKWCCHFIEGGSTEARVAFIGQRELLAKVGERPL